MPGLPLEKNHEPEPHLCTWANLLKTKNLSLCFPTASDWFTGKQEKWPTPFELVEQSGSIWGVEKETLLWRHLNELLFSLFSWDKHGLNGFRSTFTLHCPRSLLTPATVELGQTARKLHFMPYHRNALHPWRSSSQSYWKFDVKTW